MRVVEDLAQVPADEWNALAADQPFLRHEFFSALHETGCAAPRAGWLPQFLTLWDGKRLRGALPLYLKSHSYGEYVFDWAWADAYARHGLEYYPKLLAAVPFSPVTGRARCSRATRASGRSSSPPRWSSRAACRRCTSCSRPRRRRASSRRRA